MALFITITAFMVLVPFAVGVRYYRELPTAIIPLVWLLGTWSVAEVYCFVLRLYHVSNSHVSFILIPTQLVLFLVFYFRASPTFKFPIPLMAIGFVVTALDYVVGNQFSSLGISYQYIVVVALNCYLYYEIVTYKASQHYFGVNLTLLFYLLSSFPYFFAYEWLRIRDMHALMLLGNIHAGMHAICYLVLAYQIWKSSLLSAAPRSYR